METRAELLPRETTEEKRNRLKRERQQADAYMRYRMDVIAQTYSVHLKDLFLSKAYKVFLQNCGKELERLRLAAAKIPRIPSQKFLEVNDIGEVKIDSSRIKIPRRFYRTTKLASWRIYRHHHDTTHRPAPAVSKGVSFIMPQTPGPCNYREYVSKVADEMVTTSAKQAQMMGQSKRGSFLLLTPFEKYEFKQQLRDTIFQHTVETPHERRRLHMPGMAIATRKLTERKLEEKEEQTGKKVMFKGRGLKGQKKSKPGRISRGSENTATQSTKSSEVETESETIETSGGLSPATFTTTDNESLTSENVTESCAYQSEEAENVAKEDAR